MHLKKKASVLISTLMILSLMSVLGCFIYKMMRNNNELSSFYTFDKDIYNLNNKEEEILYNFMKELNKERKEKLSNSEEESTKDTNIFEEGFEKKLGGNLLNYNKNEDKLFLITNIENDIVRKREIKYKMKEDKILLVPTFTFEDKDE